jgi:hypothetical protein
MHFSGTGSFESGFTRLATIFHLRINVVGDEECSFRNCAMHVKSVESSRVL